MNEQNQSDVNLATEGAEPVNGNAAEVAFERDKGTATLIYVLMLIGFVTALTFIAGVIIAYVKREDVQDPLVQDHLAYQIRTFWWSALWLVLGSLLAFVFVGYMVVVADCIWTLYRQIKGLMRLGDKRRVTSTPVAGG